MSINPIYLDKISVDKDSKPIFLSESYCQINTNLYSVCNNAERLTIYEKKDITEKLKRTLEYFISIID